FHVFSPDLYAGSNHGVYRSSNSRSSWTHLTTGLPHHMPITSFAVAHFFYAGTAGRGVPRSVDGSAWQSSGPPAARVNALVPPASGMVLAGTGRGLEYSIDEGVHGRGATLDSGSVECFVEKGTPIFAGPRGLGVMRSTDDGVTWSAANTGLPAGSGVF